MELKDIRGLMVRGGTLFWCCPYPNQRPEDWAVIKTADDFHRASLSTTENIVSVRIGLVSLEHMRRQSPFWKAIYYEKLEVIAKALHNLKRLEALIIASLIDYPDTHALSIFLKHAPRTKSFSLYFKLRFDQGNVVAGYLDPSIRCLSFIGDNDLKAIDSIVPQIIQAKIRSISLDQPNASSALTDNFYSILESPSLSSINLRTCFLTKHQCRSMISALGQQSSNLKSLTLANNRMEGDAVMLIFEAIKGSKIKKLTLGGSELVAAKSQHCNPLESFLAANKSLQRLTLETRYPHENDFDPTALSPVIAGLKLNTTLKVLSIDRFHNWNDRVIDDMIKWLESETFSVRELSILPGLLAGPSPERLAKAKKLLPPLTGNRCLKKLCIDFEMKQHELAEMASLMNSNSCLEHLTVRCPSPAVVSFDETSIRVKTHECLFAKFLRGLQTNCTLKTLHIDDPRDKIRGPCHFDLATQQLHLELVGKNYTLCRLDGKFSPAVDTTRYGKLIAQILRMNEAGRKYVLTDPSNKVRGVKVLSAVNEDLASIYFHLRENPILLSVGDIGRKRARSLNAMDGGSSEGCKRRRIK